MVQNGMRRLALLRGAASLALSIAAFTPTGAWAEPAKPDSDSTVSEIIVTAQRREERLQDVPLPITAVTSKDIERRGVQGFADYLNQVPGVSFQDFGVGKHSIVMRGVTSGADAGNPTVGIYYGDSVLPQGLGVTATGFPNVKPFDLERIEVLRGPQGTLYGGGAMGGGVRILPASPNTSAVQGLLQADAGSTAHGSLNYNAAGMFNAPIVPHLVAVRGSLYHYEDSGYIDNNYPGDPALGVAPHSRRNAGRAETAGGRIAMLLTPTEAFSVKVSALMQNTDTNGLLEEQPSLGKWKQSRLFDESLKDHFQIYSLDVGYDFGPVKLASNTSYFSRKYGENRDISAFFGLPFSLENSQKDEVLTQELRLSSDYESSLTWIAGLYLQSERDRPEQTALWRGDEANSQAILGQSATTPSFLLHDVQTLHQYAAFGEATWQITPTFAAIVGGRWSSYDYDQRTVHDGVLNGGLTMESVSSREHVFTPKLELRYSPSRNRNFYALAAKGYRVGAPNVPVPTAVCGADLAAVGLTAAPAAVKSDSLWNYEVGAKTAWDHGRVTANAAAFQIEWSGIQSAISLPCGFNFGVNAGKVRSQGLELEIASRFGDGWVIGLNTAYVHAVLVEPLPSLVGITGIGGARVPGIPEWTVAANIQRDFHVMDRNAYARLDASYVSGFLNQYPQAAVLGSPPDSSGDYTLVNARLGVDLAPSVTGELYIDNMFDERAKQVVSTEIPDHRTTFARPRTAGVVLRWRF